MAAEESQIELISLESALPVAIAQVMHKKRGRKPKILTDNASQIGRPQNARSALETSPQVRRRARNRK